MKHLQIINTSDQNIKIACKTSSSTSKGVILKPGEFCIAEHPMTAIIEAQMRKKFVIVDENFDNSKLQLKLGITYSVEKFNLSDSDDENADKLTLAREMAEKYINKNLN